MSKPVTLRRREGHRIPLVCPPGVAELAWPGNDRVRVTPAGRRAFTGELLAADEGLVVDLG